MEVEAGNYHYEYCPTEDLRQRYNNKTMFKDMMHDPEAMKVIERVSPMLMYFLSTGNQDYFYESIQSLENCFIWDLLEKSWIIFEQSYPNFLIWRKNKMADFYRAEKVNDRVTAILSLTGEIMYLVNGSERSC